MSELPEQLRGNPDLTKIALFRTELNGDQIEILEKLPKLRVLYLDYMSFKSETMVFSQGGFPHLEFLTLLGLHHLKERRVEKRSHASSSQIAHSMVPDGLQDVTTLKELTIHGMGRRFCRRVEEGGEDFYKIKHVPSLYYHKYPTDLDEPEMEEAAGASQVVAGPAGVSHQESTGDAPPPPADEETEEIQASSTSSLPCQ